MPEKSYKKKHMTSFQLIIMGFAGVILLGTVLLMLPFSSAERRETDAATVTTPSPPVCMSARMIVWPARDQ